MTGKHINEYLAHLVREKKCSTSHQSQVMSAIKMFYGSVVEQGYKVEGVFQPKQPQKLPKSCIWQPLQQYDIIRVPKNFLIGSQPKENHLK